MAGAAALTHKKPPTLDGWAAEPKLDGWRALVYVDGDMVDGRSQNIPLIGMRLAGSYTIAEAIKDAREQAVRLRVTHGRDRT